MNAATPLGRTQVLVVGAGPVGLFAALSLRRHGVDVRVIDRQTELGARSFPVVLHPHSLRLLSELGLSAALFWRGCPVTRLAIYTEYERRAVLDLPKAKGIAPGLLTLPQDVLRQALLNALASSGVQVQWGTRLVALRQDGRSVRGTLAQERTGSIGSSPDSPLGDGFEADYVIGADGYDSTVRQLLGLSLIDHGALSSYAFFDAVTPRAGREAQVSLSEEFANAVYPLQDGLARFSFQLDRSLDRVPDAQLLKELAAARFPWYAAQIERCTWSGVAEFRKALVQRFGLGRVWLAGEAAHLTVPLGVHSLNVGLTEAGDLSRLMIEALEDPARAAFGLDYDAKWGLEWRELLGLEDRAALSARSPEWARRNLARLIPCLPASDADLDELLEQLRVVPTSSRPFADV